MTDHAAETRRGLPRAIAAAMLAVALGLVILLVGLYLARRQIAREAVTDWLRSRGVASESRFEELGPGRLVGRLRIGPKDHPDLVVDHAEVSYSLTGLVSGQGLQVTSIRLVRPVLRARWQGGRFSAGELDRLIEEFRKRPPKPGAPSPRVEVRGGVLLLATDYGALRANADALIDNAKLIRLTATTAPTRLAVRGVAAELGAGRLEARGAGGRLTASLRAPFAAVRSGDQVLRDGALTASFDGGYPDLTRAVVATGAARAELRAASAATGAAATQALRLNAASPDLRWLRDAGGDRLAGGLKLAGEAHGVAAGDLRLASAAGDFDGGFELGKATWLKLSGGAEGRGAWTGLGAPVAGDSAEIAAVKRGLRAFRVAGEGLGLSLHAGQVQTRLAGPVRLLPAGGGELRLGPAGGGYRLTAAGGGLPKVDARIHRVALSDGGAVATLAGKAALSLGPLEQAAFDAAGTLRVRDGVARFTASRCVQVRAAKLELGENDVEHPSARLCPGRGPLLTVGGGGWAIAGRAEQAAGAVPFLQAALSDGAGQVRMADTNGRLAARIAVAAARVRDTAEKERFRPLTLSGEMGLAGDLWRGGLDLRTPNGPVVAHVALRHDGPRGVGSAEVATGRLVFAANGLQPADLSPLAGPLGSGVEGAAEFTGGFRWTPAGATSGGDLTLGGLDFKSPAGRVSGLAGEIHFTSLAPLIAPPGQTLHAARIDAVLPLTEVSTTFGLEETALVVTGGEAATGGGKVRVARLTVPLAAGRPIQGTLDVEGVQLHDLVEASPFGDRMELDARVTGRIPFEAQGEKVRVAGGELHAIAPGRLSISRAALTSVSAQGSVDAPAAAAQAVETTDTFTDFAYQALENLAFDKLDAGLNTRADGRLGVLFHIIGKHDPPKPQEIRISLWDLLRRRFMDRKLPLPSGTQVDLTLDTTLNLDDLLKDYADYERLRSSPPVQR